MELIVDNNLKHTYSLYFGNLKSELVLEEVNNAFTHFDPEIIIDAVNIIKTSITLGFTYTRCYDKIVEEILDKFPTNEDIDKFIVSLVVKIMIASGADNIEELMKTTRNIEQEVTAKYFRVSPRKVTDDMIKSVLDGAKGFSKASYSINDQSVSGWDEYFYNICRQVARNSKCLSRRIGAVLVRDKSIISTGYNGPPRGVPRCDLRWKLDENFCEGCKTDNLDVDNRCPRHVIGCKSGEGLDMCIAGHAERNSLINAARLGIKTKGTTMYMTCGIPCGQCMAEIINAGVKEIVVTSLRTYDNNAIYLLKQSDLGIRFFNFVK